jgi:hypothetical protein
VPLKDQFKPTLGELASPFWRRLGRGSQALLIALALAAAGAVAGGILTILPASYSHGGKVPFSFRYKGLYATTHEGGAYVRVARTDGDVAVDSFEVAPLRLDAYQGSVTGALPLYAASYERALRARYGSSLQPFGEGKTRVNKVPAYDVFYKVVVDGVHMLGRDVLITPEGRGVRDGVAIEMLTQAGSNPNVKTPAEVAGSGVLKRPLETFSIG